ncbi:MAG: DUF87 domain-containing protein [Pseudomonadota bacterium]
MPKIAIVLFCGMKLYVRILLVAGTIEYGVFALGILLGYFLHWSWYGASAVWLLCSQRFVKRYLVPPLFPRTKCHQCHEIIELNARFKRGETWTDGKSRHVLQVHSPGEYEVGSFACPQCDTTIEVQKVTKKRLANWKIVDADTVSANLPAEGDLELGTAKGSIPSPLGIGVRTKLNLPIGTPVCTTFAMLKKHMAVFGKTGSGKSTLLISMVKRLMEQGEGVTVFDPAGDLAEILLKHVPADRAKDVVYFNLQDIENPPPFNILHETDANDRNGLPDELVRMFESLYAGAWGAKLSFQLRMAIRAALEIGGSLADVYDLFANPDARHKIASQLKDAELRDFWEEKILNPKNQATRYAMIDKLSEIVHHSYAGPIIRSRSCIFDADEIIAQKKILIVNLNTGTKPGYTLKILGTFIVSKMTNAAYRQSRLAEEERIDHFMFVDEFSNFVSNSFDWENGLSQIRKYGLSLCFVSQYAESIPPKIRAAIFGNAGILAAFRIGNSDAKVLKDEFGCRTRRQLMKQAVGECRVCLDGEYGALRTQLHSIPLKNFCESIKARTRQEVEAFRLAEHDQYQSADEREEEIRVIERMALQGQLPICEFA